MDVDLRTVGWTITFVLLVVFSVPWFLWGSDQTASGLPLWLWWHIGWMGVASVVFAVFARTDWDRYVGVTNG